MSSNGPGDHPPLVVEARRGAFVERRHVVDAAVADRSGRVVASHGDPARVVPVRSTVKILQAVPLVESGAADAFGLTSEQLALACGSHSGEEQHCRVVARWLGQLGLDEHALGCGPSLPMLPGPAEDHLRRGGGWSRLRHSCSGKHAGFLTLARYLGASTDGYLAVDHPVQKAVLTALADRLGTPVAALELALDGCGAPVACSPLVTLARAIAGVAAAPEGSALHRLLGAMAAHPELVAGPGRFDTRIGRATDGRVVTKIGADGIHVAVLRDLQLGIAVKVVDGERRAGELALHHLLVEAGVVVGADDLADLARPQLLDDEGRVVGSMEVVNPGR